jgi:L-alanine-DL-glutamate epimerase-like enolase superfamily enzyme
MQAPAVESVGKESHAKYLWNNPANSSQRQMKITKLEPIILHAPVTRGDIADSTHKLSHWVAPGVAIHTDTGHVGYGFSGTHAHLPTDRLIVDCIIHSFGPLLLGDMAAS